MTAAQSQQVQSGSTNKAIVVVEARWLVAPDRSARAIRRVGRLGAWAKRAAVAPEDSVLYAHLARVASELRRQVGSDSISVGITSTGPHDRQGITALGLATIWARWERSTILVEVGNRHSETGRTIPHTHPSLADVVQAIRDNRGLPAPQPLSSALDRLDVLADLEGTSLGRLADAGMLDRLDHALRQRYERIVWSLPAVNPTWSPSMLASVIDRFIISARRGYADQRSIRTLAALLAEMNLPPLQLMWHR